MAVLARVARSILVVQSARALPTESNVQYRAEGFPLDLPGLRIADVPIATRSFALARQAASFEVVVAGCASITIIAIEIHLAHASARVRQTLVIRCSVDRAEARFASRGVIEVSHRTLVALQSGKLRFALAFACAFSARARGDLQIAFARLAHVHVADFTREVPKVAAYAPFAIDTVSVMLAVQATATAVVLAVNIDTQLLLSDLLVVDTFGRVPVALARFALECATFGIARLTPLLLHVRLAACLTVIAACVVTTSADHFVRRLRMWLIARFSMA